MTDHELVKTCMYRILKQLGFDKPAEVTQRDLEFFCDQVEEKTGITISLSTAKRLLQAQFTKLPQIATLNAIARLLGYTSWQSFKQEEKLAAETNIKLPVTEQQQPIVRKNRLKKRIVLLAATFVVMFFLIAFASRYTGKKPNFEAARFNVQKTTANKIPNTVVFHYNVDEVNADSFFIQQSWDRNRRVRVYKNQYTLTDIYYEPGYHTAKLIANDKIIKTFDVSIPTDKWFFCAKDRLVSSMPEYINKQPGEVMQSLSLTKEDLERNNIDTRNEKHYILSYFPSRYEITSDSYVFKARIKRTAVRNDFCPYIMLEIFCQKNFMYFQSMKPGCSSNAFAQFGEHAFNGKSFDLSSLCANVDEWQDYEVVVKNKQVQILINGKKVFETSYKESSGLITGLGFISNGLCEVEMTEVESGDGKLFYSYRKPL